MPVLRGSCSVACRNEVTVSGTSHIWITMNPTRSLQLPQHVSEAYLSYHHEATSRQTAKLGELCPPRSHSTLEN